MTPTSKLLQLTLCKDALFKHLKRSASQVQNTSVLIDFSLTVKAATLIFTPGRGSAISSAKEGRFYL